MIATIAIISLFVGTIISIAIISYNPVDNNNRKKMLLAHSYAGLELEIQASYKITGLKSIPSVNLYSSSYKTTSRIFP